MQFTVEHNWQAWATPFRCGRYGDPLIAPWQSGPRTYLSIVGLRSAVAITASDHHYSRAAFDHAIALLRQHAK